MTVVYAALSALCYGTADFSGGMAARSTPVQGVLVLSQFVGLLFGLAAAALILPGTPAVEDLLWGAAAGLAGALGLAVLYYGLASALITVVSPVAAATGAAVPVVFGYLLGERPGTVAWIGVLLALVSILLLTYDRQDGDQSRVRGVILGLSAGVGFGLFFILISRTGSESGVWPLIAGRIVSVTAVLLFSAVTRRPLGISWRGLPVVILAGVLDMSANVFFILSARSGLLMISTVITSLYPAPTVALSLWILRERLTLLRAAGVCLAVGGVALMTL